MASTAATKSKEQESRTVREQLKYRYREVRAFTEKLTEPLEIEDFVIQVVEHASPAKWHLAHTSWFFETFILEKVLKDYKSPHPQYSYLFNSYYLQTGEPHCRDKRGNLSRPTVQQVYAYRSYVDAKMLEFLNDATPGQLQEWAEVVEIGLNHEQQHQELMLTDLKYLFSRNPLYPVYKNTERPRVEAVPDQRWIPFEGGVREIGHDGNGFSYDNEHPRHKAYLQDFELASRLVTNGEYLEFINDGGYERHPLWLDEGFAAVQEEGWDSPLHWMKREGEWHQFTLSGLEKVDPYEPVAHISYYEADAFARWAGCRLPTEAEWEVAAEGVPLEGNFVEEGYNHPVALREDTGGLQQMYGDVWEWTQSSYSPYPGYEPLPGALGEYNGKFMCNQYVLRGGSCATSRSHIRKTYRNFFHAHERWQFMGLRLARQPQ